MNKNKIISRFYVIYGDNTPIYVGYTNRTVRQRFKEHQKDKDFSSYSKVEVKEVDRLAFDFTWDMKVVNANAKQVSNRESELIYKYNTQGSVYQKGLCDIIGGQTWSNIKAFVHSNKDNPKYVGMNSVELFTYLADYRNKVVKLQSFIGSYKDPRQGKLQGFVKVYQDPKVSKLSNFINNYKDPKILKISSFISSYKDHKMTKLKSFMSNYQDPKVVKLHSFINNYQNPRITKLSGFIHSYQDPKVGKLRGFISDYREPEVVKLQNFIGNYQDPIVPKLHNFIGRYQDPKVPKLHRFISRYRNNN